MNIVLHGTVRGRTVELDRDPGIEERVDHLIPRQNGTVLWERSRFKESW